MSKIKRLISLILVFCLMAIPFSGFAEEERTADYKSIDLLVSMGIIDADDAAEPPESFMSRAELAVMTVRLCGVEPVALSSYDKKQFYDVEGDYQETGYINAATAMGLIDPVENGYFAPTEAVDYNTAVKALLTVLGWHTMAEQKGGTAADYLSVAVEKKLIRNNIINENGQITRENIYKMIDNSLDINALTAIGIENGKVVFEANKNLLAAYHNVYEETGILEATYRSELKKSVSTVKENEWKIGTKVYDAEKVKAQDLLGYRIKFFYQNTVDGKKIIYAEPWKNEVVSVKPENVIYNKRVYEYINENGKEEKLDASSATVLYNGRSAEGKIFTPVPKTGLIVGIDNNSDGDVDVLKIESYQNFIIEGYELTDNIIYTKYDKKFKLSDLKEYTLINTDNEEMKLTELISGMVISVAEDIEGEYLKIIASDKAVVGTVEEVMSDNGIESVRMGDAWYELSSEFLDRVFKKQAASPKIGTEATLLLDAFGKIADSKHGEEPFMTGYQYGIITGADFDGMKSNMRVKIFSQLGLFEIFKVNDKPIVDGKRLKNQEALFNALCKDGENGTQGTSIVPQLIRFKTDENGILTTVDMAGNSDTENGDLYLSVNSLSSYYGKGNGYSTTNKAIRYSGYFNGVAIASCKVVFKVPMENEKIVAVGMDDAFSISAISGFRASEKFKFLAYKTDPNLISQEVLLVPETLENGKVVQEIEETADINVYVKSTQATDREGNPCTKIYYYSSTAESSDFLADDVTTTSIEISDGTTYSLKPGDIFRFKKDYSGKICKLEPGYSLSEDRFMGTNVGTDEPITKLWKPSTLRLASRLRLVYFDGSYLLCSYGEPSTTDFNDPAQFYVERYVLNRFFVYDTEAKKMRQATEVDLLGWRTSGEDYARGIVWKNDANTRQVILFK